jgi:hypothetical protein
MRSVYTAALLLHAATFAAPRIASYRAEIRLAGAQSVYVQIDVSTTGDIWPHPEFSIAELDDDQLSDLGLDLGNGQSPPLAHRRIGRLDRVTSTVPVRRCSLRYIARVRSSGATSIPLAVPDIPTTDRPGSVTLIFDPPSGDVIAGDSFPAFRRDASGAFVAALSNVPNHVQILTLRANQASFRERYVTPTHITDFVVLALLVLGSVARACIRPRGGG